MVTIGDRVSVHAVLGHHLGRLRLCLFCAVCACFSWGKRSCLIVFVPDSQEAAMRHLLVGASGQGHWLRFAWVQANPRCQLTAAILLSRCQETAAVPRFGRPSGK